MFIVKDCCLFCSHYEEFGHSDCETCANNDVEHEPLDVEYDNY